MDESTNVTTPEKEKASEHPYLLPVAIIIAGLVIGGAVIFADRSGVKAPRVAQNAPTANEPSNTNTSPSNARPVDTSDHVLGAANAQVTLIEYSDFQCPFCAQLHPELKQVLKEYDGKVRWVYRNFPLTMIHQNAQSAAVAAECAAELGGNDAYWKMTDMLFGNQTKLGEALYLQNAKTLKINEAQFKSCLTSGRFDARIAADTQNGMDAGGTGTPYVVILDKDGNATFFSGALPFEQIKTYIDQALGA